MTDIQKLIDLLVKYLEKVTMPVSTLEWFVNYLIPIIQVLVVVGGAIAAIYKYYSVKNREINEKMLNEVYAPLYQYFVNQQLYCYVYEVTPDYDEGPILEITSKKSTTKFGENNSQISYGTVLDLNRSEFLKVLNSVNIGLASKELFTLLNMYKVVVYVEDNQRDKTNNGYLNATIMKIDIEKALRKEIIRGYEKYHKKLKLTQITKNNFYSIKDDNIQFNYKVNEEQRKELKREIINNPDKFNT